MNHKMYWICKYCNHDNSNNLTSCFFCASRKEKNNPKTLDEEIIDIFYEVDSDHGDKTHKYGVKQIKSLFSQKLDELKMEKLECIDEADEDTKCKCSIYDTLVDELNTKIDKMKKELEN